MNLFKMLLIISSSFHSDYPEHKFWVLGNGSTDDDSAAWAAKQNFSVNFSNVKTHVCYFLHYNDDNGYLLANGKNI